MSMRKSRPREPDTERGGRHVTLSLDFAAADGELSLQAPAAGSDLDGWFHQEWVRALFAAAVDDLRSFCTSVGKEAHFALFERYDLEGPETPGGVTYARLADDFGLAPAQVTNHLAFARRQFRRLLLGRLRTATGTDEEFRD